MLVSIHALLAECDPGLLEVNSQVNAFQSTHSLRSATLRSPLCVVTEGTEFQSTHSLRSATVYQFEFENPHEVSIHALLAECDVLDCFYNNI